MSEFARTTGPTVELASWAATVQAAAIPEVVRTGTARLALDAAGCGVFGASQTWSRLAGDHVLRGGGHEEATVWGSGSRVSLDRAPLANGTAVHAFEFDDVHPTAVVHAGSQVLPVVCAVAEARERAAADRTVASSVTNVALGSASAGEVLAALVVGFEVAARIGLATGAAQLAHGFHPSPNTGAFASAAAAGRLLELDADAMAHAFGVAGSCGGYLMAAQYGGMTKRLHAGHSAQAGLTAALLAADGFTGTPAVLEAPYGGFAATHARADSTYLGELTTDLDVRWETPRYTVKAYPCCGSNHTSVDAYRAISARVPGLSAETIERIDIRCSTATLEHVGWPYVPGEVTTAQMNLAYCLSAFIVDHELTVEQFAPARLADPQILALVERIHMIADPAIDALGRAGRHTVELAVTTGTGRTHEERVEHALGSVAHPLTHEQVTAKYHQQVQQVLDPDSAAELAELVLGLAQNQTDCAFDIARVATLLGTAWPRAEVRSLDS